MRTRSQTQQATPNGFTVTQPKYLANLRDDTYRPYMEQVGQRNLSNEISVATYRRAHTLASFGIFMAEATEFEGLEQHSDIYPKLLMPFSRLSEDYMSGENIPEAIKALVMDFKEEPIAYSEQQLRNGLWDELNELLLRDLNESYPRLKIDMAIVLRNFSLLQIALFPLMLVEVARDPLSPELVHKDELKLAVVMAAALRRLFYLYRHQNNRKRATLKVFGLLVGEADFEVTVIYPDFGGSEDTTTVPVFIYRSSRQHWRFSLFAEDDRQPTAYIPDGMFCCAPAEGCRVLEPDMSLFPDRNIPVDVVVSSEEIEQTQLILGAEFETLSSEEGARLLASLGTSSQPLGSASQLHPPAFTPSPQGTFAEREEEAFERNRPRIIDFRRRAISWPAVGALIEVEKQVKAQAIDMFVTLIESNYSAPPDGAPADTDRYCFDPDQTGMFPRGLPTHSPVPSPPGPQGSGQGGAGSTTSSSAELDFTDGRRVVYQCTPSSDDAKISWVDVVKRSNANELKVYSCPAIHGSPFFPRVQSISIEGHGLLKLVIEKVVLQCDFADAFPQVWDSIPLMRLVLPRFFLDLMGALRTLHAAGFVHSDLSPSNIGYNKRTRMWQLFDFNQAMSIEASLQTRRTCGTPPFASARAQRAKIFTPFDDYTTLLHAGFDGFPRKFFCWGMDIIKPLLPLLDAFSELTDPKRVNVDEYYVYVFKVFCHEHERLYPGKLTSDPSYLAALPIVTLINAKMEQ